MGTDYIVHELARIFFVHERALIYTKLFMPTDGHGWARMGTDYLVRELARIFFVHERALIYTNYLRPRMGTDYFCPRIDAKLR